MINQSELSHPIKLHILCHIIAGDFLLHSRAWPNDYRLSSIFSRRLAFLIKTFEEFVLDELNDRLEAPTVPTEGEHQLFRFAAYYLEPLGEASVDNCVGDVRYILHYMWDYFPYNPWD